jgi:hypothetical protein
MRQDDNREMERATHVNDIIDGCRWLFGRTLQWGRTSALGSDSDMGAGCNVMRALTSLIVRRESVFRRRFNG